jgi:hypothetical protein
MSLVAGGDPTGTTEECWPGHTAEGVAVFTLLELKLFCLDICFDFESLVELNHTGMQINIKMFSSI